MSIPGLLLKTVQGFPRESPAEGNKLDQGSGASPLQGKAERPGTVHSGEEETERGIKSSQCEPTLQCYAVIEQGATGINRNPWCSI